MNESSEMDVYIMISCITFSSAHYLSTTQNSQIPVFRPYAEPFLVNPDRVHFGAGRISDPEVGIAEEALSRERLTPEETKRNLAELKKNFGPINDHNAGLYYILSQFVQPDFAQSEQWKEFIPKESENTPQYLSRIYGEQWTKHSKSKTLSHREINDIACQTLYLRCLLKRPLHSADLGLITVNPIRLFTRIVELNKIFKNQETWSKSAALLLTSSIPRIREKAEELTKLFSKTFGPENREAWKSYPLLLHPGTTTLKANMYLLNYFGFPPRNSSAYFSIISRSTDFLLHELKKLLNEHGFYIPDEISLPTTPTAQSLFETYLNNLPGRKERLDVALAGFFPGKLLNLLQRR
jgi:hypothetical protein